MPVIVEHVREHKESKHLQFRDNPSASALLCL
jgi:hypothetical protein